VEIRYSLKEIRQAANKFWNYAGKRRVVAFFGQIGAGKTTFIHALCNVKGVKDVVGSPTFSIINEYHYKEDGDTGKIFHIDLYRLKDEAEAIQAGVEECLYSDHTCLIEWPDRIPGLLPDETLRVFLEGTGDQTRVLRISDI